MILHILNGDCALPGWRQCGFSGEALVWRENYLQGVLPDTEDVTEFNRIRAAELHKIAPEKPERAIFAELQAMHQKLCSLQDGDSLVLWLDRCPFDEALKKRLLHLIAGLPDGVSVYLVQQDVTWDCEAFQRYCNWQDFLFHRGKNA